MPQHEHTTDESWNVENNLSIASKQHLCNGFLPNLRIYRGVQSRHFRVKE